MVKSGVPVSSRDHGDSRKRLVRLSPEGLAVSRQLEHVWEAFEQAAKGLFDVISMDVISVIEKLERARQPAASRPAASCEQQGAPERRDGDCRPST